jgi:hypothetical protein
MSWIARGDVGRAQDATNLQRDTKLSSAVVQLIPKEVVDLGVDKTGRDHVHRTGPDLECEFLVLAGSLRAEKNESPGAA